MQDHGQHDHGRKLQNCFLIQRHDAGDDGRDGHYRNRRENPDQGFQAVTQQVAQDEAVQQREDHDPEYRADHGPEIDGHPLPGQKFHQRRGGQGGEERGGQGHDDGQGHVCPREIGDDVGGRARRAASDQDDAQGRFGWQVKHQADGPGDERHEQVLESHAHSDRAPLPAHACEIREFKRQAHAEHDDPKPQGNMRPDPGEDGRMQEGQQGETHCEGQEMPFDPLGEGAQHAKLRLRWFMFAVRDCGPEKGSASTGCAVAGPV